MHIGVDIIEISRVMRILEFEKSLHTIFTKQEIESVELMKPVRKAEKLAGKYAVKEAVSKALGTGLGELIAFNDIETLNEESGKPYICLYGNALLRAGELGIQEYNVSISHDRDHAIAMVVLV